MTVRASDLTRQERAWLGQIRDRKPLHRLPTAVSMRLRRLGLVQTVCGWSEITHEGECVLREVNDAAGTTTPPMRSPSAERKRHREELLDEALAETFPASDVPTVFREEEDTAGYGAGHSSGKPAD